MTDCEVKEYFSILQEACHVEESSLDVAYRQLRELLERLCRTQMPDGSLQMTDLSARISFVASKAGLSTVEQNRLHTFRLTSNAILNRQTEPQREQLLRDAKTLAFFVKRLTKNASVLASRNNCSRCGSVWRFRIALEVSRKVCRRFCSTVESPAFEATKLIRAERSVICKLPSGICVRHKRSSNSRNCR